MVKIKQKKTMNLPQLIEWAWDNDVRNKNIRADQDISAVFINKFGDVYTTDDVKHDYTFTIEVEEEITEDTKFRHIVFIDDCGLSASWGNSSINDIKFGKEKEFHAYIDGEFKLIWRNGKLVV